VPLPFQVGPLEIVLVLAIALIVLGPKGLPSAARQLGKGLREFKESISLAGKDDEDDPMRDLKGEKR
jgi:sec-independent protein translocase protein TatA